MSRGPWRITEPMGKVAYVVGAVVIGVFLVLLLAASPIPETVVADIAAAYFVAWVVVGVRVFRGAGEQVEAPRAWWRMTARPAAGFVLAAFLGLGLLVPAGAPSSAPQVVAQVLVALAYLGSSTVLVSRRARARALPPEESGPGRAGTIEDVRHDPGDAPE